MRLNLDILAAWLPEQWRIKQFGSGLRELTLARPRLYEPGVAIQADTLYLTRAEMLPAAPPEVSCSFVCIGRKIPKPYLTAGLPILQLPDAVSLTEVYNRVQEIYDKFDTWDSHLRDELEKDVDFDIRQLLLLASGFLRRGVNVVDSNLQRLFSADFDPQTGASIIDQHGPMPMEHNERIKEVCTLERVIREPYQTALDFDGRAYCKNLYVSDQFCGCISVNEFGRRFQAWEFPVMAHFFSCFQRAYFIYLRAFGRQENAALSALRKVLGGRALTDEEQQELVLDPQEAWLLFELRAHKNEQAFPVDYMYATLNAAFPQKVYAVIFHEKIVGLLRTSRSKPFVHQAIDEFAEAVFRMGYGGFMVNWIIGHTNRFAAACAQRSFSNMINFEYLSDIGLTNIRSEHLGSCEQDVDALWNESPLKYAPNCNTPTLFIHSDEDWRCPLPDALEMFSCLKRAGCPARLCLFHGENHELSRSGRPDNRITRLQEILNWFKAYLQ